MTVTYNNKTKTYTIEAGTKTSAIQKVINSASDGATILFGAGTHVLTKGLNVQRDHITLRGISQTKTKIVVDLAEKDGNAFYIRGRGAEERPVKLAADVKEGEKFVYLSNTKGLKVGDVLHIAQENTPDFLKSGPYSNITNSRYLADNPLRESLVEIKSISGNRVELNHAVAYDMDKGVGYAERYDVLSDITFSDMTITYNLGTSDHAVFQNVKSDYVNALAINVKYTKDFSLSNVVVNDAAATAVEIRAALEAHVDGLRTVGAHNKGGGGNGYGLHIAESFYGTFDNLKFYDMRHGLVFSSWNAEAYNKAHIIYTNRDINFHGSPDHSNVVIVDEAVYKTGKGSILGLVSPGGSMHPYTDLSKNLVQFKHAVGSLDPEVLIGNREKAYLNGMGGNDILIGGGGYDFLNGGSGNDILRYMGGVGQLYGVDGNDVLEIRVKGSPVLDGGAGDDVFRFFGDYLTKKSIVDGGEGRDTLRFHEAVKISGTDMSGVTGIEKIIFDSGRSILSLNGKSFSDAVVIQGGSHMVTLKLNTAMMDHNVYISNNIRLYLADDDGQEVRLTSSSSGWVSGGAQSDTVYGRNGEDRLYGNDGMDFLYGGHGEDKIIGGAGDDHLWGGPGKDAFFYKSVLDGRDIIHDFNPDYDRLNLGVLFDDNGLGGKSHEALVDGGYLRLAQDGRDAKVGVDLDGYAGHKYDAVVLAVLENVSKDDLDGRIIV